MKKLKNKKLLKKSTKIMKVRVGSVKNFFSSSREVMHAADKRRPIKKRSATLTFVDPTEMLNFLSASNP